MAVVEVDAKIENIMDQTTIDNKLLLLSSKNEASCIFSSIIIVQVERKKFIFLLFGK